MPDLDALLRSLVEKELARLEEEGPDLEELVAGVDLARMIEEALARVEEGPDLEELVAGVDLARMIEEALARVEEGLDLEELVGALDLERLMAEVEEALARALGEVKP